jgi:hypothetical protein
VIKVRTAIVALLIIFAIYAVIQDPTESANRVGIVWDWIKAAVNSIFTFFDALLT